MSTPLEVLAREERRNKRFLSVGIVAMAFALVVVLVRLSQFAANQEKVLTLAQANFRLLDQKNSELQTQVDASRVVLTQLYAALNASQKQVEDLGGTPLHFEFTVPSTTTTTVPPPPGKPAPTTTTEAPSTSQQADSTGTSPIVFSIESLIISPVTVTLPPDAIVPPELTLPPVPLSDLTVPPDITVPTIGVP